MIGEIVEKVQTLFGRRRLRKKPRVIPSEENHIDLDDVSRFAIDVCRRLQSAGYSAYIVGGAVRDLLIGKEPKDFDVATDATPEQVRRLTRRAIIIGRRFRLVHVIKGPETIEVSTYRALEDGRVEKSESGRILDDNVFGEQYEDAARRDFTINAMYFDPITGDVLDYHSGMQDIRKRRLRMIGDPQERYREDPVRILRAIRIAAKLDFKIDPMTARPMERMQHLLADVPQARLLDEMLKMLMSGASVQCAESLVAHHIVDKGIPMLSEVTSGLEKPFVRKAFERCDARVHAGKSLSPSFIFAVLLWDRVQAAFSRLSETASPAQRWLAAVQEVVESPLTRGIQQRFIRDMRDIWLMQHRFERRNSAAALRLLNNPRFRAAYDFLLIRATVGEVAHELADWWTALEAASDEDRQIQLREYARGARQSGVEETPPKKRRRRRRRNFNPASDDDQAPGSVKPPVRKRPKASLLTKND